MLCNKCSESHSNWDELESIQVCPQRQAGHGGRAGTQLRRAERQTAAAGSCQPHQSATDRSACSVGTGMDTDAQRPEDRGQELCCTSFAVIIKSHSFSSNIRVVTLAVHVLIKPQRPTTSGHFQDPFDRMANVSLKKPQNSFLRPLRVSEHKKSSPQLQTGALWLHCTCN